MIICIDEWCEDASSNNQMYKNDFEVNASAPKDNWFARHLNRIHKDNATNIVLFSTCFIDGVDGVSSCDDSDFSSSHAESAHDSDVRNGLKVFTNPLYGEEFDVDQHITCYNVYKGALHGVINPLF